MCGAASIAEVEYLSYRKSSVLGSISYFDPPLAAYRVVRLIHGLPLPEKVEVPYAFDDGSACLEPQGWKFSEALMPAAGSRWVLFLLPLSGGFQTYSGDFGRVPAGSLADFFLRQCREIWAGRSAKSSIERAAAGKARPA